ncbi:HIT domain-containing protein [Actinobacteria bacterium YIM 96077]|uniref:Diadenosine tetraphosphate hydrolase n=1 Tax=Phytoactinopolyspora halophila TaxID=1981511 RepID=A0A329QYC3_9ACTN|nr:HIT domain-containing protein [Phytoactinopolyspora halophila]AYY13351.1 HIT domain-containing protein [Actinobacteria bacterium YIM 96077]RAW17414.1 diadenosine tetraphosphate hydrolase [Phytoactinopolyspora halophila]
MSDDRLQRLWTPYRMAYIKAGNERNGTSDECPLCRIPTMADDEGLIVFRGTHVYAVLNLHPYNPGHLMVVTNRHVGDLEELTDAEMVELTSATRDAVEAIKTASRPHGFNVGLNLGGVAGGSLSAHLHQHVVPRWSGDANFMTVLGETKVMPQLLADTRELLVENWPTPSPSASPDHEG